MSLLIFIAAMASLVAIAILIPVKIEKRRQLNKYGMSRNEFSDMSDAAMDIIQDYRSLPKDNRPIDNINSLLLALDAKFGVKTVDGHIQGKHSTHGVAFDVNWYCRHPSSCEFKEYHELHNGICEVKEAVAEQNHALLMSQMKGGLDAVKSLTEQLRVEHEIITETTRELTS